MVIDITTYALLFVLLYLYAKSQKKLRSREAALSRVSLDYVKANRKCREFQTKYDRLLTEHARDIGFKK